MVLAHGRCPLRPHCKPDAFNEKLVVELTSRRVPFHDDLDREAGRRSQWRPPVGSRWATDGWTSETDDLCGGSATAACGILVEAMPIVADMERSRWWSRVSVLAASGSDPTFPARSRCLNPVWVRRADQPGRVAARICVLCRRCRAEQAQLAGGEVADDGKTVHFATVDFAKGGGVDAAATVRMAKRPGPPARPRGDGFARTPTRASHGNVPPGQGRRASHVGRRRVR